MITDLQSCNDVANESLNIFVFVSSKGSENYQYVNSISFRLCIHIYQGHWFMSQSVGFKFKSHNFVFNCIKPEYGLSADFTFVSARYGLNIYT